MRKSTKRSSRALAAVLAALGTASYGQREIARHRDDKKERSRIFWELELLCAATTAVCLIVLAADCIYLVVKNWL